MAKESKLTAQHEVITDLLEEGLSRNKIAEQLGESPSTVKDYINRHVVPKAEVAEDGLSSDQESENYTEIPVIPRDYSDQDHHFIYPLGDLHIGSEAFADDRWQEWITYLNSRKNASLLGTGDFLNSALKTSVSETYDEKLNVGDSKRKFKKDITKLAKDERVDLLMPGNHEARIYRAVGDCPIRDVADALEVPYARDACVLLYKIGDVEYSVYVRHGTGGGQVGARANRLAKQAQTLIADVYVSGHTHSQLVFPQEVFYVDPEELEVRRKTQYFVSSGSFLQYEGYAAVSSFAPTKIGAPRIRLDGRRHDVHVSV